MAKYDITHMCGHSRTVQLYGKHKDRERTIDWLGRKDCPQCEREKAEPMAHVFLTAQIGDEPARLVIDIQDSYKIKDVLKSTGYRYYGSLDAPYDACGAGIFGMLATKAPPPVWRMEWPATKEGREAHLAEAKRLEIAGLIKASNVKYQSIDALMIEAAMTREAKKLQSKAADAQPPKDKYRIETGTRKRKDGTKLPIWCVTSPYDPDLVKTLRSHDGARWVADQKFWAIPQASVTREALQAILDAAKERASAS